MLIKTGLGKEMAVTRIAHCRAKQMIRHEPLGNRMKFGVSDLYNVLEKLLNPDWLIILS